MVFSVLEAVAGGQDDKERVQRDHEHEELAIRVEPELPENPLGNLWFGRRRC